MVECDDQSTSRSILQLHIYHNTPCLPPKTLHSLCFVYLLVITVVPREIKDHACAKMGGGGGEGGTRCIMGNVKMANREL